MTPTPTPLSSATKSLSFSVSVSHRERSHLWCDTSSQGKPAGTTPFPGGPRMIHESPQTREGRSQGEIASHSRGTDGFAWNVQSTAAGKTACNTARQPTSHYNERVPSGKELKARLLYLH